MSRESLKLSLELGIKLAILMSMTIAIIWGLRPIMVPILLNPTPSVFDVALSMLLGTFLFFGMFGFAIKFIYWEPRRRGRCK